MTPMTILLTSIISIVYAHYEGVREAYYYHLKRLSGRIDKNFGEHSLWVLQRTMFFIAIGGVLFYAEPDIRWACASFAGPVLSFPLFHDSGYYWKTHELDVKLYKNGWTDQSTTSQAKSDKLKFNTTGFRLYIGTLGLLIIAAVIIHQITQIQ